MYGIVLSRRDTREADQTISILTAEEGKRDYLARGVKKIVSKNASFLEPPSLVSFGIAEGKQDISYLTNVQPVEQFFGLRRDLAHLHITGYAIDAIHVMFKERSPDTGIYQFVVSYLSFLDTLQEARLLLLDAFLFKLFSALGYQPILDQCVVCEKPYKDIALAYIDQQHSPGVYFAGGGIICSSCLREKSRIGEQILSVGIGEISTLTFLLGATWKEIAAYDLEETEYRKVHKVIYEFVLYHSERNWEDWIDFLK